MGLGIKLLIEKIVMFWEKKPDPYQIWRPVVLKLLKSFGVLWGTSQVESNSIAMCGYIFEDTCQNSLMIFVVFWPWSLL